MGLCQALASRRWCDVPPLRLPAGESGCFGDIRRPTVLRTSTRPHRLGTPIIRKRNRKSSGGLGGCRRIKETRASTIFQAEGARALIAFRKEIRLMHGPPLQLFDCLQIPITVNSREPATQPRAKQQPIRSRWFYLPCRNHLSQPRQKLPPPGLGNTSIGRLPFMRLRSR